MQYPQLGRSGLVVSRIGLGCMSYRDPARRPWVLDEAAAMPVFRRAIAAGINFLDTADMHSQGASEVITGEAPREYGRRAYWADKPRRDARAIERAIGKIDVYSGMSQCALDHVVREYGRRDELVIATTVLYPKSPHAVRGWQ